MAHRHHEHPDSFLFTAVEKGDIAAVRTLIETGADVNSEYTYAGLSPFQVAASHGRVDIVQLLIQHGHDPTRPYANGRTQLEEATKNARDFAKIRDLLLVATEKKTRRHPLGPRPDTREPRAESRRARADTGGPEEEGSRRQGGSRPM